MFNTRRRWNEDAYRQEPERITKEQHDALEATYKKCVPCGTMDFLNEHNLCKGCVRRRYFPCPKGLGGFHHPTDAMFYNCKHCNLMYVER